MDIVLERILTLIPRKEDGEFVHGALKEFAESIGLKSGNLISDWIAGRSKSYKRKLHEISAKYDVSVEWLMGETDIKEKTTLNEDGLSHAKKEAWDLIQKMDDDTLRRFIAAAKAMLGE